VLQPHDRNVADQASNSLYDWNSTFFELGLVGKRDFDFIANDWGVWTVRDAQLLPAFRVEGTPVAEPSTCALLGLGAALFWFAAQRQRD
jgi:hypothetical protein